MGKKLKQWAEWRREENLRDFTYYYRYYEQMIKNMFVWEGMPDGISTRFLEDKLFHNGLVIMYKSLKMRMYVVAQATPVSYNIYEEPNKYQTLAVGTNGESTFSEIVKATDCVAIWNNQDRFPSSQPVSFFAKRLSNIIKTFDINLEQMKNPYIIQCPEGQRETIKAIMEKKTNGEPYIFTSDDYKGMCDISVFDLKVQNHTQDLLEVEQIIKHQGLSHFGIDNVNILKKERLTSGEVDQNDEQINLSKKSMFKSRQDACSEIQEKFGIDVRVSLATNMERSEVQNYDE